MLSWPTEKLRHAVAFTWKFKTVQLSVLTRGSVIVWHHLSHILNNIYCISFLCMACVILVVEQSLLLTVGESVPQFLRNLIVVLVHLGGKRLLTQLANRDLNPFNPKLVMQILPTIQEEND